jgi:predicted tellurium resistance membrane protein TerC
MLTTTEFWVALFTLSTLEIVLGVDNLVFISVAVSRLEPSRRPAARRFGLALACVTRILLLLSIVWLRRMAAPLLIFYGNELSMRDLVLIGGGLFLMVKGTMEIHQTVEGGEGDDDSPKGKASPKFHWVIVQIAIIDIVFSLDSVITAVGLVDFIPVMVAAIVLAMLVMVLASNPVGEFIDEHPTVKMLALAFLLLVGVALIADGFDLHIPRAYLYFAMAFSGGVEGLNILSKRRERARREREREERLDRDAAGDGNGHGREL